MNEEILVPAPCVMHTPGFTAWILDGQNQLATSHSSVEVRLWKIPVSNRRICLNKMLQGVYAVQNCKSCLFWKPVLIYAPSSSAVCDASAERKSFQGGAAQWSIS